MSFYQALLEEIVALFCEQCAYSKVLPDQHS